MQDNIPELVMRMQRGDEAAFEEIFELYKVKAVRTAYLMTGNRALADDVAQEAFIQCYKKAYEIKKPEQFGTWFFKLLTRIAWKAAKKEKSIVPVDNIFEMAEYRDTELAELDFIEKEDTAALTEAIEKLKPKQKAVVYLYYYDGFSVTEIATIMGCFEGTVKSRLHAARKNLNYSLKSNKDTRGEGLRNAAIYKI